MEDRLMAVINTLQTLNIQPTVENMQTLLGCIQVLSQVRNTLLEAKKEALAEVPSEQPTRPIAQDVMPEAVTEIVPED